MEDRFEHRAEKIADQERKIQAGIDAKASEGGGSKDRGAVQAGARRYPEPPFPEQHQRKPGEEAALEAFGRLDVVVPNAAFQEHVTALEDLTLEHFDRTLKTNLYGYFNLVKAAVPHMKSGGSIVMTGSVTGIMGNDNLLDYSMTKGGIHAFARSLGTHLAPKGIRVNVVAPGPVWTPLNPADQQAEKVAKFGSQTVMKRPAQPEEIAPAFVFLASPQCSSYITGEILPIIGGYGGG